MSSKRHGADTGVVASFYECFMNVFRSASWLFLFVSAWSSGNAEIPVEPSAPSAANVLRHAEQLIRAGSFAEARECLLTPGMFEAAHARVAHLLGLLNLHDQRLDEAIAFLEKAVEGQPTNADAHRALGESFLLKAVHADLLGKASFAKKARRELERAVEIDPENIEARHLLMRFFVHAPRLVGGSRKAAQEQVDRIREVNARAGLRAQARLFAGEKELNRAIAVLEREFAIHPDHWEALLELGRVAADGGEYATAFNAFDRLLSLMADHPVASYEFGRTCAVSGERLDEGIAALERYLSHHPKLDEPPLAWAHYRLGLALAKRGRIEDARRHYLEALRISPDHPLITEALRELPRN